MELSDTVAQHHRQCVEMCGNLDSSLSQKMDSQDERLDVLSSAVEAHDAQNAAGLDELRGGLENASSRLDSQIAAIRALIGAECSGLD